MWQSLEILNVFNTLTLKQIFWKTQTLLKKLEYRFLFKCTKIKNAAFLYKTALSEADIKKNRLESTKWTYHKERSFASNFIFWKTLFLYKKLTWCKPPKCPHSFFSKVLEFYLRVFFPISILTTKFCKHKFLQHLFSRIWPEIAKIYVAKISKMYKLPKRNVIRVVGKHRYRLRPQMSRQMPRIDLKWVGRCCLSFVKLGHAYPLSRLSVHHLLNRFPPKTVNEKKFLST